MTRQCMRPGCDRQGTACLTYDADTSEVWLQDPRGDDEPSQVVCSLHAGSLTVPLGWTVTDRRSLQPAQEPQLAPEPERVLEPEREPEPEAESEPRLEPVHSATWQQLIDAGEVRSRPKKNGLLDRAFEWTGPQHSILTTAAPGEADEELPPVE